jgi:hypothetical protein
MQGQQRLSAPPTRGVPHGNDGKFDDVMSATHPEDDLANYKIDAHPADAAALWNVRSSQYGLP